MNPTRIFTLEELLDLAATEAGRNIVNAAAARLDGWEQHHCGDYCCLTKPAPTGGKTHRVPRYVDSLDAVATIEDKIGAGDLGFVYQDNLAEATTSGHGDKWHQICAKPVSRCIACILTLQPKA